MIVNGAAAADALQPIDAGTPRWSTSTKRARRWRRCPRGGHRGLRSEPTGCCADRPGHLGPSGGSVWSRSGSGRSTRWYRAGNPPSGRRIGGQRAGHRPGLPLVVGCGEAGWRKGADLFVDVARTGPASSGRSVRLGWPSAQRLRPTTRPRHPCRRTRQRTSVARGAQRRPEPLFAAAQVLVMTSGEDPQPLVPLEAARVGHGDRRVRDRRIRDLASAGRRSRCPVPGHGRGRAQVVSTPG